MSQSTERPAIPQSMRHKRILSVAEEKPDATLQDLADEIPTATVELVENVLEKYGDPAADEAVPEQEVASNGSAVDTPTVSVELTDVQRETLRAIEQRPEATQRELGEQLGVSPATISNRVNTIEGFDWNDREAFVERVLETESNIEPPDDMASTEVERETQFERFDERLVALEERVGDGNGEAVFDDPELVHKVVHASMQSEAIDEDEELRIIEAVLGTAT